MKKMTFRAFATRAKNLLQEAFENKLTQFELLKILVASSNIREIVRLNLIEGVKY